MDSDLVGQHLAPKLAEKIGSRKTYIVDTKEIGIKGKKY